MITTFGFVSKNEIIMPNIINTNKHAHVHSLCTVAFFMQLASVLPVIVREHAHGAFFMHSPLAAASMLPVLVCVLCSLCCCFCYSRRWSCCYCHRDLPVLVAVAVVIATALL